MLRIAEEKDLEALTELLNKLFEEREEYKGIFSAVSTEELVKPYLNPNTRTERLGLILEHEGVPVGLAGFETKPCFNFTIALISALYLAPEFRSKGLMSDLLETFELWGKQVGAKYYHAGVSTGADLTKRGYMKYEVLFMKKVN